MSEYMRGGIAAFEWVKISTVIPYVVFCCRVTQNRHPMGVASMMVHNRRSYGAVYRAEQWADGMEAAVKNRLCRYLLQPQPLMRRVCTEEAGATSSFGVSGRGLARHLRQLRRHFLTSGNTSYCRCNHRSFCVPRSRFCVGQVKATGNLRVSSTAPYFVDDRLHCPEEDMQDCKPLHLCVSLVPDELLTPAVELQKNKTEFPTNIGRLRNPPAQSTHRVGIEPDMNTTDEEKAASREVVAHGDGGSVVHGPASEAREATPAEQPPDRPASSDNAQPTPWVLDICLVRVSSSMVWRVAQSQT